MAAFFGVAAALYAANRVAPWANYPNSLKAEYVAAENKARQQGHVSCVAGKGAALAAAAAAAISTHVAAHWEPYQLGLRACVLAEHRNAALACHCSPARPPARPCARICLHQLLITPNPQPSSTPAAVPPGHRREGQPQPLLPQPARGHRARLKRPGGNGGARRLPDCSRLAPPARSPPCFHNCNLPLYALEEAVHLLNYVVFFPPFYSALSRPGAPAALI